MRTQFFVAMATMAVASLVNAISLHQHDALTLAESQSEADVPAYSDVGIEADLEGDLDADLDLDSDSDAEADSQGDSDGESGSEQTKAVHGCQQKCRRMGDPKQRFACH